jgi:hypothetical protein
MRRPNDSWSSYPWGMVANDHTRAIVPVDEQQGTG